MCFIHVHFCVRTFYTYECTMQWKKALDNNLNLHVTWYFTGKNARSRCQNQIDYVSVCMSAGHESKQSTIKVK